MTSAGHNSEIYKKEIYFYIIRKFGINSPKILKHKLYEIPIKGRSN